MKKGMDANFRVVGLAIVIWIFLVELLSRALNWLAIYFPDSISEFLSVIPTTLIIMFIAYSLVFVVYEELSKRSKNKNYFLISVIILALFMLIA